MTPWDKFFEEKLHLLSQAKTVLDVGGGVKFGKGLEPYKPWFARCDYKTLDIVPDYRPDILGDIHNIPVPGESFEAVICKAVLEHVADPQRAVSEIHRILKSGGMCLAYVPFLYPYHAHANYRDYYRYSRDGIRHLFRDFSKVEIMPVRGFFETWFYFLPFGLNRIFAPILGRFFDKLKKQSGSQASGYHIFAVK